MQAVRCFRQLFAKVKRVPPQDHRCYAKKVCFPEITMNDLPSPEGDWYTLSNKQQSKYNVHLVLGIGSFIATLAFGFATDQFESFNDIPEEPAEIDCYK